MSTVEKRENVVSRGQSILEAAEEELFVAFTTDRLLEDGYIGRLRDVIDRGIEVYVGSRTRNGRDLVRYRLPRVTIWELQLDRLSLPPHRERLGGLAFADRRAVLLGSVGEPTDSVAAKTALTAGTTRSWY